MPQPPPQRAQPRCTRSPAPTSTEATPAGARRAGSACGLAHPRARPSGRCRSWAILLAAEFGDLQPEVRDHRLGGRDHRARLGQLDLRSGADLGGSQSSREKSDLGGGLGHGQSYHVQRPNPSRNSPSRTQPAFAERCVQRGLRQSIPSSKHATADLAFFSINVTVAVPSFSSVGLLCGFDGGRWGDNFDRRELVR